MRCAKHPSLLRSSSRVCQPFKEFEDQGFHYCVRHGLFLQCVVSIYCMAVCKVAKSHALPLRWRWKIDCCCKPFALTTSRVNAAESLHGIPLRMQRPAGAREALVEVHWWRQAGHTPPVSKVFHSWPQLQDQRSSLRGDQPQSGQRMRGLDGSRFFCGSNSGSRTTEDFTGVIRKPQNTATRRDDVEPRPIPQAWRILHRRWPRD